MSRLAYTVTGPDEAPVLIAGPSLGSTSAVWDQQATAFAGTHRFVRFDLPGHGASAPPDGPLSMNELGRMVVQVLDQLRVPRAGYIGVSISGMIGLAAAAAAPERISRLMLVSTSAYLPPASGWLERAELVRRDGPGAIADAVVGRWFTKPFQHRYPAVVAEYRDIIARTDRTSYAACCEAIAAMDLRPVLAGIQAPTLVIAGREDPAVPPVHGEVIAASVRGARVTVLDNAAHLANVERAAVVTALMAAFLEDH
jgi:3-oxoadipate enol-lactonase